MESVKCSLCGSVMEHVEKKVIAETEYNILKCKKCKHTVAKSS